MLYRAPHATEWERLDLETAMDMVADRMVADPPRRLGVGARGHRTRRCMSIAALGGATLDNEENYLIKKLMTALGIIQIENQARVCHSSTVVGLGTSFGRGASSTLPGDLQNSDLIVLEGSNMAEAHPVAFQWVVEAKARGATIIHVDPHYSRTSALADMFVPLRAGTDIAFLGAIINHVISTESDFREYVLAYTNAADDHPRGVRGRRRRGLFSGFDPETARYDPDELAVRGRVRGGRRRQRDQEGNLAAQGREGGQDGERGAAARRTWTPHSSIRGACGRSSSATTPATRRRWSSGSAASPRICSPRSASCSSPTPGASARRRSCTASAGRSTRSARSTSAPRRSCSCCWATWAAPAAA